MNSIEYFYGLTLFGFIVSCMIFAATRWFHMCKPYHLNVKYYYPARTTATLCYLSFAVLLPFVIHPLEPRAWLFTKTYLLVMIPFYGAQMLFCYFGAVKSWYAWRKPGWVIQSVLALAAAALWIWAVWPGVTPDVATINKLVLLMIVCGVISFIYVIWMLHWIYWQLKNVEQESYSNPSDFPSRLARQALVLIVLSLIFFLPPVVADSPLLMGITLVLSMGINTYLLILILHPHRYQPIIDELIQEEQVLQSVAGIENIQDTKNASGDTPHSTLNSQLPPKEGNEGGFLSDETVDFIRKEIKKFVEGERQYLNQHLTVKEVAEHCSYGRTYVSYVFKNEMGGFFNYVNKLRLQHADRYRKEHHLAGQEEIALESGFSSRQSYYAIRRRMEWK